ncbi:SymE family type I addiction module toxin [Pantoea sp. R102]|uniref:SymE family type I addiction module toxin n=1 Tax=Pantoea sp. R102 TaxID=2507583 RepID=UPI0010A8ABCD|nr:SymE family type I addiction module toxin [Pantoea sp. R102]THD38980.1 type I toxin-antitoxin system SymE family toxin [Pantoea sp. R102]
MAENDTKPQVSISKALRQAECDSKAEPRATAVNEPQRHYTLGYTPNGMKGNPLSQLMLKGCWVEDLAFNTEQSVLVTVERERLVIETELRF